MTFLDNTAAAPAPGSGRLVTHGGSRRLAALAGCAVLLEAVLLFGILRPLSIRWHPHVVPTDRPLATVLGTGLSGALQFGAPVLCAFALFALAFWLVRRLAGPAVIALVLLGAVVYAVTLLPMNPVGAQDIYHNVADARTLWLHGDNPTVLPPNAFPDDPFYPNVPAWRDFPSVYGPVWYMVSGAPLPLAGDGLWANVVGQKALAAAFLLVTTVLAMAIAGRIRPGAAAAAGLLIGWNPLLLFETAGNGHNDVVMVCFALAALYAVTRRWWAAVFPLLALAVAVKYIFLLLGPVLLIWMLRRHDVPRRSILLSLAVGAVVTAVVYAPFVAGVDLLEIVHRQASYDTSSPSALVVALLSDRLGLAPERASSLVKLIVAPLFFAAYGLLMWRIPRDAGLVTLMRAGFWAVFLLLTVATWWFWPWYLLWLVPLAALLPEGRLPVVAGVFSATAMLMYVPYFWLLHGNGVVLQAATAATAFILPVIVALLPDRAHTAAHEPLGALTPD